MEAKGITMVAGAALLSFLLLSGVADAQVVINVGHLGITGNGPLYIAMDKGYYKELGLEIKLERFAGAGPAMAPLANNQIQAFLAGGITEGLFNGAARGLPIVVVASTAQVLPKWEGSVILLRSDLKDTVNSPADLKGRKVAINARSSPFFYVLGRVLETGRLKLEDIELVTMAWPDMRVALERKAIDVAFVTEPFITFYTAAGLAVRWMELAEVVRDPYIQISVVFFNRDWAAKNLDLAGKFMIGWIKGARDYHRYALGPKTAEITDIFMKYTGIKDRPLFEKMKYNYINPNGYADVKSIEQQQDWYYAKGYVPVKAPIDKVVDHTYVKYALERIGEFKE